MYYHYVFVPHECLYFIYRIYLELRRFLGLFHVRPCTTLLSTYYIFRWLARALRNRAAHKNKSLRCRFNGHLSLGTYSTNAQNGEKTNWKRMHIDSNHKPMHGSNGECVCVYVCAGVCAWTDTGHGDIKRKNKMSKSGNTIAPFRPLVVVARCRRWHIVLCVEYSGIAFNSVLTLMLLPLLFSRIIYDEVDTMDGKRRTNIECITRTPVCQRAKKNWNRKKWQHSSLPSCAPL